MSNAPERFLRLVSEREHVVSSGWENGLAVPYARVDGLTRPLVVAAKSDGIDFDAPDGKPTRLILMILTGDNKSQQDLLGDASEVFGKKEAVDRAVEAKSFVELAAALNAPVQ